MNLVFYHVYENWMKGHLRESTGERRRRLEERVEQERKYQGGRSLFIRSMR